MRPLRARLGEILIEEGLIGPDALSKGLDVQEREGGRLGEILCRLNLLTPEAVARSLSLQFGCPYRSKLSISEIDSALLKSISYAFARRHGVLPLRTNGGASCLVVQDPSDMGALADLRLLLGEDFEIEVAPGSLITSLVDLAYESRDSQGRGLEAVDAASAAREDLLEVVDSGPIIDLVNEIIVDGVRRRASDIHIEPREDRVVVRFRVDGVLHTVLERPKTEHLPIISRVKVMAALDIAEKRLPQDGALRLRVAGRDVDVRVSVVPTIFGERGVLRLLDKERGVLSMGELGLDPESARILEGEAHRASGILLATGPTGSGKTTTLYALLKAVPTRALNVFTIEDPVEYEIPHVNQIQVHPRIGLSFSHGLRSVLRQDPDVMMVGEIRDLETAEIAVRAALTGHLVLSTLHTIDSFRAVTRLVDMGVQPYLLADALNGALAQRLVRVVCPNCADPHPPDDVEKHILQKEGFVPEEVSLVQGRGCESCLGTGYRGRVGIFEFLAMTDELREHVVREKGEGLAAVARKRGVTTLRADGVRKAVEGTTTIREVLRVLNEGEFQDST
ncbi:MAG: GspE/PulE family protein [Nitrospinota bacterium]